MLQAAGRRIPFAFLEDVKGRFVSRYGSAAPATAVAYEYNTEFSKVRGASSSSFRAPTICLSHNCSQPELHPPGAVRLPPASCRFMIGVLLGHCACTAA